MKRTLWFGILLVMAEGCLVTGCRSPNALPREYAAGLMMVTAKVADQGVLDDWTSDAMANLQNPGLETYVTTTVAAGVRIVGMNGRFDLGAGGDGTQLPPGMREELMDQLGQPISDAQREAILTILGWNRTTTEISPAPPGGT